MSKDIQPLRLRASLTESLSQLGNRVTPDVVVVGSTAARTALGSRFREPRGLDVAVPQDAYDYLRQQPGWTETRQGIIQNGVFDVGVGWRQIPQEALESRSWQTPDGVKVASLPDVYAWKQQTDRDKDRKDTAVIRTALLDHTSPLDTHVTKREIEIARSTLPEHLQDDPTSQVAIRLAGNGLHIVHTLYGDPEIGRANQIIGDVELPEYKVPALYHNGFDLAGDLELLQIHLDNVRATDADRLDGMAATAYSDSAYGYGRRSKKRKSYDEKRSGALIRAHALHLGYEPKRANRLNKIVLGTGFDEATKMQSGKLAADPVVQAVAGVDLQVVSEPDSLEKATALIVEDGMSARVSLDRPIGRVLNEHGVHVDSIDSGVAAVDAFAHARPTGVKDGQTVFDYFTSKFDGQAHFHEPATGHQYPPTWTLGNDEIRRAHAEEFRRLHGQLVRREITATQALEIAREHTVYLSSNR